MKRFNKKINQKIMQKLLLKAFKGLLTLLPISLTLYFVIWLGVTVENIVKPLLEHYVYIPGMGILVTVIFLIAIGSVVNAYLVCTLIEKAQGLIERIPIIKIVFGAIKDAVALFQMSKEQNEKRAVLVEIQPGMKVIGFVTGENATKVLFKEENKVAVYVPMSYQIGGFTLYLNKQDITVLDIDVETAMRIAITGGNSLSD